MWNEQKIAVVIPAWNEEAHITRVLSAIPAFVDRVFVVDDASADQTASIADAYMDARLSVIRHRENAGVGSAIVTGYSAAFAEGADLAVVVGGDGQMDPNDMVRLLENFEGDVGYVKGNRLAWPGVWHLMPVSRLLGNLVLSWMTRRATGLNIRDSQCGYSVLSRDAADKLELHRLWPRYGYPNDLLCRLETADVGVREVPIRPIYAAETSGVRLSDALFVVPSVLFRGWRRRQREKRPHATREPCASEF